MSLGWKYLTVDDVLWAMSLQGPREDKSEGYQPIRWARVSIWWAVTNQRSYRRDPKSLSYSQFTKCMQVVPKSANALAVTLEITHKVLRLVYVGGNTNLNRAGSILGGSSLEG